MCGVQHCDCVGQVRKVAGKEDCAGLQQDFKGYAEAYYGDGAERQRPEGNAYALGAALLAPLCHA